MKIAVIDIGTNSFKLMISRIRSNGDVNLIEKEKIPVKLGQGGFKDGVISEDAFDRGLQALKIFKEKIDLFEVDQIIAFATSAVRSSSNGDDFVRKVRENTGIDIRVISGDTEAELIYYGVRQALNLGSEKVLIMDIGGGSTEFIIADSKQIWWKHSFDLGASRLLEVVKPSDPIKSEEIKRLKNHLKENLSLLWAACEIYPVKILVGSSGSFDSMAEMIWHKFHTRENPLIKKDYQFNLKHLETIYKLILNSTIEKRLKMKGLAAMRVELIVMAVIFIKYIFKKVNLTEMHLSTYSLKEGILFDFIKQNFHGKDSFAG